MQSEYLALMKKHEDILKKDKLVFDVVGYGKLFFVLLVGLSIYLMFSYQFPIWSIVLSSLALLTLIALWIYHSILGERAEYAKGIISICNRHIDRITGKWTEFTDTGEEFADAGHAYACDLDVVGRKSLFQFLNTTSTWHGRHAFAADLLRPAYGRSELQERQKAVAELSGDIAFSCNAQLYLSKITTNANLAESLKESTPFSKHKAVRLLLTTLPALTCSFILCIIVLGLNHLYIVGASMAALQMAIWFAGSRKIHKYIGVIGGLSYKLSVYNDLIGVLTAHEFSCDKLKQQQGQLREAAKAIKSLGKIGNRISIKHNGLIYFFANVLLLWDYGCAFSLQGWKEKYAHSAGRWFEAIGEFESLLSFSHLPNLCNNTCMPAISDQASLIEAEGLGHPLILNDIRVDNNICLSDNIFIISGSNMSGKTTLLRTVGVNLVLARSGGFVCAKKMTFSPIDIVTSMRITDDLNEGVSTFYAELQRIKMILDASERQLVLFLIDEIFKGTNSADRLTGAKTVIARLNELDAVGLISTHDLELCNLADVHDRIRNHSFSEHYKDNRICFDYIMRRGRSNTTNAKYLMEMVGIKV